METRTGDIETNNKRAAEYIRKTIEHTLREKDTAVFAIVGGSSVGGIYSLLPGMDIHWEGVHIFMADERFVAIDDEASNYRAAHEGFIAECIQKRGLPTENVHPFRYDSQQADGGVAVYNEAFRSVAGKIDILLVSSGEDGHIASLFPNHPSVYNNGGPFIVVEDSPKPPPRRMSAGTSLIQTSSHALLLFFGESKRAAFAAFCDDSISAEECPAALLRGNRGLALRSP